MSSENNGILYDSLKGVKKEGEFTGSIITRCADEFNSIIFSDNIKISGDEGISISQALQVGFKLAYNKRYAFSERKDLNFSMDLAPIEYSVLIPNDIMNQFDEGQFSETFPFTIRLLHTAGLYYEAYKYGINHLDFFTGEILKNPISLIMNGIILADRVVINEAADPVFYDCIIVGRDDKECLSASYEPLMNVKKLFASVQYIIILGIEELKL
ncbi:MAG: hypothetical protein ACFFKA_11735 [Candidatus Thorarchaeota archaeon]